jgi:diguanylate cyclase (GGDEF)-like protein
MTYKTLKENQIRIILGILMSIPILVFIFPLPNFLNELSHYLFAHNTLETISFVACFMIFGIGIITIKRNNYELMTLLACLFLSVGVFDFLHVLTYPGMPEIIYENDHNRDLLFWILARSISAFGLLFIALHLNNIQSLNFIFKFKNWMLGFTLVFIIILSYLILYKSSIFPTLYHIKLTQTKILTEYFLMFVFFISSFLFWRKKDKLGNIDMNLMFQASLLAGISELFFTTYTGYASGTTILGHGYKAIAYIYLYRAIVVSSVEFPYHILEQANNDLDLSLNASHTGIWYWNLKTNKITLSKTWKEQLGYLDMDIGKEIDFDTFLTMVHPEDISHFTHEIKKYISESHFNRFEMEYRLKNNFDNYSTIMLKGIVKSNKFGSPITFIGTHVDITEIRNKEQHITYLANYDTLTNLPNRNFLQQKISHLLTTIPNNEFFSILFMDLDYFKNINDSLGHHVGDELLVIIGKRLKRAIGEHNFVARVGGDEFVILLKDPELSKDEETHTQYVKTISAKIISLISLPLLIDIHEISITISIGASTFPTDDTDNNELSRFADMALYEAKNSGRNCFVLFDKEINQTFTKRLTIQNHLSKAILKNEFFLVYQPQFDICDINNPKLIGFEALIRWESKELGCVSPTEFITIAESNKLIIEIGEWIFDTVCEQQKIWKSKYINLVPISINISPIQFKHPGLVTFFEQTLIKHDIPSSLINIELTEGVMMENVQTSRNVFNQINKDGFRLLIDDFGTGYSSLSYLKEFDIYKLKIDQSFIRNIHLNQADCSIIKAIINIAETLNFKIIAEGVETLEEANFLKDNGCHEIQGYLLGKPLNVFDAENVLKNHQPNN